MLLYLWICLLFHWGRRDILQESWLSYVERSFSMSSISVLINFFIFVFSSAFAVLISSHSYFSSFCSVVSSLFATPWTVAHQAPLSMGVSRQEYWSGLPFPSPSHSHTLIMNFQAYLIKSWIFLIFVFIL